MQFLYTDIPRCVVVFILHRTFGELPCDPARPLLAIHPEWLKHVCTKMGTGMYTAPSLTTTEQWGQPNSLSTDKWSIHTEEYCSVVGAEEGLTSVTTWGHLTAVMLRQTRDTTWCRILWVTNVQNRWAQRGRVDSCLSGAGGSRVRVAVAAEVWKEGSGISTLGLLSAL